MIGLVTDSNSQLPPELARRYGVAVVPLTVTVDGVAYLEGAELGADEFYARFDTARPTVSTSQPSAGQFAQAYRDLAARGAGEILSIHVGSSVSGTLNAARLAAEASPVPVQVVDTGTVSFGVACCVWEAAEALAAGARPEKAADLARDVGRAMGTVWVVGALDLARAGGRLATAVPDGDIPVLRMTDGVMHVIERVADLEEAAEVMATQVRASTTDAPSLRAGIGLADCGVAPLRDALERRLLEPPAIGELVRYRIGPSVGAHTGPDTVGAVYYRRPTSETG